jgi:hypothetical protein
MHNVSTLDTLRELAMLRQRTARFASALAIQNQSVLRVRFAAHAYTTIVCSQCVLARIARLQTMPIAIGRRHKPGKFLVG